MSSVIQVVVVEDDARTRESLEIDINRSPGLRCVATFSSMESALEALPELVVDVAVLDVHLPGGMEGSRGTNSIKKMWPRLKVLILSGMESDIKILQAFARGADGYLCKSAAPRETLAEAIKEAYKGGAPMCERVRRIMASFHHKRIPLVDELTATEEKVLGLFNQGFADKETAEKLAMSPNTVKEHIRRIVRKSLTVSRDEASFLRRLALL